MSPEHRFRMGKLTNAENEINSVPNFRELAGRKERHPTKYYLMRKGVNV
jgi:hypothetical protein